MQIWGIPMHPMLVHFPVALLSTSVLWDGVGVWTGTPMWWELSFWTLVVGLLASLPAALTGFIDYVELETDTPPEQIATRHLMVTGAAVAAFLGSLLARGGSEALEGTRLVVALTFSLVGVLLLSIGGHLGAELVYEFGIGQHESGIEETD